MTRENKGFSLVELVVTIAIMAVLTTVGVLSFGLVTGRQIISCAEEMEGCIGETKMQAMSRANAELEIFVKADGVYANMSLNGAAGIDEKIGKTNISVKYKTSAGAEVTLTETERLVISFDRASGAFKFPGLGAGVNCTEITISGGSRTRKIVLVPQTGKYYIEE